MNHGYSYNGYQLNVSSEIKLPIQEIAFEGLADVRIEYGAVMNKPSGYVLGNTYLSTTFDEIDMGLGQVGWFHIERDLICVEPYPGVHENIIALYLIGSIWGSLLHLRGVTPFHASGYSINNKACLIMADSGAGKSTLLHGMLAKGARFITDDLAVISTAQNLVCPSFSYGKVDESYLDGDISLEPVPYIEGEKTKFYMDYHDIMVEKSLPLTLVIVLEIANQSEVTFEWLKGSEKLKAMMPHIYRGYLLERLNRKNDAMVQMFKLVSEVPILRVKRPRESDTKDFIIDMIKGYMEGL